MIPDPVRRFPIAIPEPPKAVSGIVANPKLFPWDDSRIAASGFREDEGRAVSESTGLV